MKTKIRHPEKVNKPINPIKKKPDWIRSKLLNSREFFLTKTVVNQNNLVTVCQEANCPNITECWSKRHATFMIMGDTCTRACAFCDVKTGKPESLDPFEPYKISNAVKKLNLKHVVITSVDRDDLNDGGSNHFFEVINATRKNNPNTSIEVLTPDFLRKGDAYKKILEADLDVFNHNIETVPRLYLKVRPGARYFGSLELLKHVVITSVDRDDLKDGGSNHFFEVINATRKNNPNTSIEVLTPDFLRKGDAYKKILETDLDVFNHNIETVPRLYLKVRPGARYFGSLELLKNVKKFNKKVFTKSGLMVGLGEDKDELIQVMDDLRSVEVDFLTIGQYLQPSPKHHPLSRYYHPDEFKDLEIIAKTKGFLLVSSSPLTRSSYHADEDFAQLQKNRLNN